MRGFAVIPLIILVTVVLLGGGLFWFYKSMQTESVPVNMTGEVAIPFPSSVATSTPSASVVGTTKPTVKPTTKATPSPTPSPSAVAASEAPKTGCAEYDAGGGLGSLKVTIQAFSGQLVGDAAVTIKRKYDECKGVDPGFPLTQVISQGSTSTTFSGMRPGPFKIEVMYHGNTSSHDVGISSGDNSTTVNVSN